MITTLTEAYKHGSAVVSPRQFHLFEFFDPVLLFASAVFLTKATVLKEAEAGLLTAAKSDVGHHQPVFSPRNDSFFTLLLLACCNHEAGSKNRRVPLRAQPSETSIWSV